MQSDFYAQMPGWLGNPPGPGEGLTSVQKLPKGKQAPVVRSPVLRDPEQGQTWAHALAELGVGPESKTCSHAPGPFLSERGAWPWEAGHAGTVPGPTMSLRAHEHVLFLNQKKNEHKL